MFTEKCKGCSEHECSVPYLEQEIKDQRMRYARLRVHYTKLLDVLSSTNIAIPPEGEEEVF